MVERTFVVKWIVKVWDNTGTYDDWLASYEFYRIIDAHNFANKYKSDMPDVYTTIHAVRARNLSSRPRWETSNDLPF